MAIQVDTIDHARIGDVKYFREAPLHDIQTAVTKDHGFSSLCVAVISNQLECCKMIYSRCPSLLYHSNETSRYTAMHQAAARGLTQVIEFLIWANDQKDYVGEETDVESGLRREQIKNLNLLTMQDLRGWVPLHHAVAGTSVETVKMLIEADHGRDSLKMVNINNETPLLLAVKKINLEMVRGNFVIVTRNIEMVKALIEADHGRDSLKMFNGKKETPLHMAVRGGNIEMVKALVEANPDFEYGVDESGDTPLSLAIKAKSGLIISLLLKKQPAVNEGDLNLMNDIIEILPSSMEVVDNKGRNCLHLAVKCENLQLVQRILGTNLSSPIVLNGKDIYGHTPLHVAALTGNEAIIRCLLYDKRVDKMTTNNQGQHVLDAIMHLAVKKGNIEMVTALIKANPDFEYGVDKSGDTPLSLAIKAKSVKTREECEFPTDVLCKDKFLIQSVITNARTTEKDVTSAMFTQESGTLVQECKLKVFSMHQDPSSVPERLNDGSSTRASVSDNNLKADEEPQEQSSEIMKNASLKWSTARSESIEKLMRELATDKPRQFSHEDLISFTSNLSTKLGSGAFGNVYKGQFLNGVEIAVKVLVENEVVEEEFKAEVSTMGRTYHRNLVKLYGFCFDDNMKAIVYEYASNGSLDHVLFENRFDLKWEKLYDIAVETAKALVYLHDGCYDKIIHHDIKPANVLLDLNFSPKITDFGLAKLMNRNVSHLTMTRIRGTAGYAAPETFMPLSEITYKCDVYSFGMMLFEILGRRRNVTSKSWFAKQVWKKFEKGQLDEIIEECGIIGENKEKARILSFIALWCIQHTPETRPSMSTVSTMLEKEIQVTTPPNPFLSSLPIYSMQPSQHS